MKMVSMKKTQAEIKKDNKPTAVSSDRVEYPYGLRITLNKNALKNLDMSVQNCKIGDKVSVMAKCCVKELRASDSMYGSSTESMELQIESLGMSKNSDKSYSNYDKQMKKGPGE